MTTATKLLLDKKRGFTLIELLVVVAIIGMLSSVVLASLSTARASGANAARLATVKQYVTAMQLHYDSEREWPDPGGSGWYCLGDYSDGNCWSGGYNTNATLKAEFAPFITFHNGTNDRVSSWEGLIYNCVTYNSGFCTRTYIQWFQYGDGASCGIGYDLGGTYSNATYCRVDTDRI